VRVPVRSSFLGGAPGAAFFVLAIRIRFLGDLFQLLESAAARPLRA
jgi:hypothetical protein